jgi:hypothetical protein
VKDRRGVAGAALKPASRARQIEEGRYRGFGDPGGAEALRFHLADLGRVYRRPIPPVDAAEPVKMGVAADKISRSGVVR